MAWESDQTNLGTFTASADLSSKQYHFVKISGAGTVNVTSAITDITFGVLQNAPASGEQAIVCVFGVTKVAADGTVAAGALIGSSADAQADSIAAGTDTTVYTAGVALEAMAASGTYSMFLNIANGRAS